MSDSAFVAGLDRDRLVGLAYRMLGTVADAEDAVSEVFVRWYRLDDADRARVANPVGWFAKVTSRVCLDVLKSASRRHDLYVGPWLPEPAPGGRYTAFAEGWGDPAERTAQTESVSMALLTVMEAMTPAERVAFVLRDVFDFPIPEIADILGRSRGAVRQLASSARARVRQVHPARAVPSATLVAAFQHAAATGDVAALVQLLHPDVTLLSDGGGIVRAALNPIYGPGKVARFIVGVLARQSPSTLEVHAGASDLVLIFTRDGRTSGVLELLTDTDGSGLVLQILVQWNPEKLGLWRAG